ncbi:hypothetical protein ACU686_23915 [Yinghuangia aomiensis]
MSSRPAASRAPTTRWSTWLRLRPRHRHRHRHPRRGARPHRRPGSVRRAEWEKNKDTWCKESEDPG